MKKILSISLATLAIACNGVLGDGFTVSGEISGIQDGTNVYLQKQDENTGMPINLDTVQVSNGKFVFKGEAKEPDLRFISVDKTQGNVLFIVEKGDITAKINKDSLNMAKVTGTFNNEELAKYNGQMKPISDKMMAFQKKNMGKVQEAQKTNDQATMQQLNNEYMSIQQEFLALGNTYITANPKSFVSLLLIPTIFNSPTADLAKIKKTFDGLDAELKATSTGKKIQKQIESFEKSLGAEKKK